MTTLTLVLGCALILVVLLGLVGVGWWGVRALNGLQEGLKLTSRSLEASHRPDPDMEMGLLARVVALEVGFNGLRVSTEEGVKRADAAWTRVRNAEAVAKREAERKASVDGEEAREQLSLADGGLSPTEGVPPVHSAVEGPPASDEPEYVRLARLVGYPHV